MADLNVVLVKINGCALCFFGFSQCLNVLYPVGVAVILKVN